MNRIYKRLLQIATACVAAVAFGPAIAQISNVTDGTTSSSSCTSYTFSSTGVLTFSPAGCLGAGTPPPTTPIYSFTTGNAQVVETTASGIVTVRRTGADLTTPGTVVVRWTGGTAVGQTHFNLELPPFGPVGSDLQYTMQFPAAAGGVTTQEISFNVLVVNASLPAGTGRTVIFGLLSPTGGTLGATISHTFTIVSAAGPPPASTDLDISGAAIPEFVPTGTYAGQTLVCELFQQAGVPGPGIPGAGGKTPCGGYSIAVTNNIRPAGAYNCNMGMANSTTFYGGGIGNVVNTISSATMFVMEDLKFGNTHIPGVDFRYPQHQYNAYVIKFRTGSAGEFTGALNADIIGQYSFGFVAQGNRGESAVRFAALSTQPCDFDTTKLDQGNACYKNLDQQGGGSMLTQILRDNSVTPTAGKCGLLPNTTYYLSTRWENVGIIGGGQQQRGLISCRPIPGSLTGQYCGTSLAIN